MWMLLCGSMYELFVGMMIGHKISNVKFTIHILFTINLVLLNSYKESIENHLLTYNKEFKVFKDVHTWI